MFLGELDTKDIMRFLKRVKKKIQVYRAIWNSWNYWWYWSWVCLISLIFNCSSNFPFLNAVIICSWNPTWALLLLRLNRCSWYLWSSYFLCLQGIIVFEVHYVVRFCGTSSSSLSRRLRRICEFSIPTISRLMLLIESLF